MGLSSGSRLNIGLNVGFTGIDAISRIKEGEGVVSSVAKATATAVATDTVFGFLGAPVAFGLIGTQLATAGIGMVAEEAKDSSRRANRGLNGRVGGGFYDSQNAYTMRQRSLQKMNTMDDRVRSTLGSEARTYFRNNANY